MEGRGPTDLRGRDGAAGLRKDDCPGPFLSHPCPMFPLCMWPRQPSRARVHLPPQATSRDWPVALRLNPSLIGLAWSGDQPWPNLLRQQLWWSQPWGSLGKKKGINELLLIGSTSQRQGSHKPWLYILFKQLYGMKINNKNKLVCAHSVCAWLD